MSERICPRCGERYSWIERHRRGNRVYLVAVHYLGTVYEGGKRKKRVRKCYLGPEDSYEYVTRTHGREGLVLRGAIDRDRALLYLDILISYLEHVELDRETASRLAGQFERAARYLKQLAEME